MSADVVRAATRCRSRAAGRRRADEANELVDLLLGPVVAPAALEDLLAHHVPCTSFAPKWSATAASGMPIMIQYALTFGMLSSIRRETASILRSSEPGRVTPAAPLEDRVLRMERERDEGEEAARLVLLVAQPEQVVDPLLVGLDVAVQHRAVRRDAEPVRGVVHVEPDVRVLLPGRDEPAHAIGEDLGAAAGQRAEPGGLAARAAPARA